MRLDKAIALTGMTRTEAKRAIAAGRVRVRGEAARDPGMQVMPEEVCIDGQGIEGPREVYIMVNKPAGVVTATEDKWLLCVADLLPEKLRRRNPGPVGRLDRDVMGLVLMTTNGQLAHRLIAPRWKAEKTYLARCEGRLTAADAEAFRQGVTLSDFVAKPAEMRILESTDDESVAETVLTEGKFHQVKRMFAAIGHPLIALKRTQIGCVALDEALAPGEWRELTAAETEGLLRLCGLHEEDKHE